MLIIALASLAITDPRPPRPNDDALRAALADERPQAQLLSLEFRESNRGGARIGCALGEIAGAVEPLAVIAAWRDRTGVTVRLVGAPPPPPETPRWEIRIIGPEATDRANDGEIGRDDRNYDVLGRKMALTFCPELTPPAGQVWALDIEPHPDPARAAQAERFARAATDLIFGRASPQDPAHD